MSAPPTYRALVRREEQRRIAEREAARACMACGKPALEAEKFCAEHLSGLDKHRAAQHAASRNLSAPLPPPFTTPRIDAHAPPSSRRRGAP